MDINQVYQSLHVKGEKTTVKGSCSCGAIKYTINIPIASDGTFNCTRCNCSRCQKFGTASCAPPTAADFTLISPRTREEISGDFTKNPQSQHRYFCNQCGVHVFQEAAFEMNGQKQEFNAVNIATFDQPQDGIDLNKAKVHYWDGLHNNWAAGMQEKPFPNGLP